jgi:predicted metalloprotease with PDZ domain
VGERDVERVADAVTGLRLGAFFRDAVYGTRDLPLARLLAQAGLDLKPKTEPGAVSLGVRTAAAPDGVKLVHVHDGGAAQAAGLSAGDVVIAVDGLRVTNESLKSLLARHRAGDVVEVHAFRRDELIVRRLRLARAGPAQYELVEQARPKAAARRLRRRWLGA